MVFNVCREVISLMRSPHELAHMRHTPSICILPGYAHHTIEYSQANCTNKHTPTRKQLLTTDGGDVPMNTKLGSTVTTIVDTDIIIKAKERSNYLFFRLHNHMNTRSDALVHQFCRW